MTRGGGSTMIYVGNLPLDVRESELDKLFYSFGRIKRIDLKVPMRPPAYAFIDFEDPRDAEDAVEERDGYSFAGEKLRVRDYYLAVTYIYFPYYCDYVCIFIFIYLSFKCVKRWLIL